MITKEQIEQAAHDDYTKNEDSRRFEPFIAGAQWALEQERWISVEERMPKRHQYVLIATPFCKYVAQTGLYNGIEWKDCDKVIIQNVTHWQPLPLPPKTA